MSTGTPAKHGVTKAVEDYAKAIYALQHRPGAEVTTSELAKRLRVSPASASAMVKKLGRQGLVRHAPYQGIELTETGSRLALEVMRHHRLLELYLAETLGLPWDRVHDEAEELEHVLSEELEDLIAAKLGHPKFDPHGDPIPGRDGRMEELDTVSLGELEPGERGRFVRVSDSEPGMLRYLAERSIHPGQDFAVEEKQPFGGPLFVRFESGVQVLGGELANAIRVRRTEAGA